MSVRFATAMVLPAGTISQPDPPTVAAVDPSVDTNTGELVPFSMTIDSKKLGHVL